MNTTCQIEFGKQLSTERMNEVIRERVPYEERMKFTYLPIIVMDIACNIGDDVLNMMKAYKSESTKKYNRVLRQHIKEYRQENEMAMKSELFANISCFTNELYMALAKDLTIHQLQYQQALLSNGITMHPSMCNIVAYTSVIKRLLHYVMDCDRQYSKIVSERLRGAYTFRVQDCIHCLSIIRAINEMFKDMDIPELKSDNIDLAFKIFKNKLDRIVY